MHEEALLQDLVRKVDEVARAQGARRVTRIVFRVGALSHLDADALTARWPMAARGTPSETARLEIHRSTDLDDPHATAVEVVSVSVDADPEGGPPAS